MEGEVTYMTRPCRGTGTGRTVWQCWRPGSRHSRWRRWRVGLPAWSAGTGPRASPATNTANIETLAGLVPEVNQKCQFGYNYTKYRHTHYKVSRSSTRVEPKVPVRLQTYKIHTNITIGVAPQVNQEFHSGYKHSKYRNVSRCSTRGEPKVPVRPQIHEVQKQLAGLAQNRRTKNIPLATKT